VWGFTLVELLVVIVIVATIGAIGIPNLIRSRTTANESSAVGNVRALGNALAMYRSANNAFPADWQADLFTAADPDYAPQVFHADMQSVWLTRQGYQYRYRAPTGPTDLTYVINAHPAAALTGTRTFWIDESEVIHHCVGINTSLTIPAGAPSLKDPPGACS